MNPTTTPTRAMRTTVTEAQFGQIMRSAMNESAQALPSAVSDRLQAARREALKVRRGKPQASGLAGSLAQAWGQFEGMFNGVGMRLALAAPALVLGVGVYVMSQTNAESYVQSVAEIDTQVLSQDVPLDALLDKGFARYVQLGE